MWPRYWDPWIKNRVFWQLAMTGGLWTESRKEDPEKATAGAGYFLGTAFLWTPPYLKSSILWNPVTKGYLLGASIGTAISTAIWGKEGGADALDFYAAPADVPAKTTWAFNTVTDEEQTWDRELAEFFLNGVGLQSKHQRDQALVQAEVEVSRSTQEKIRLMNESFVMGSFTEPYDLYRYGFIDAQEYVNRVNAMRAKSAQAKRLKAQWDSRTPAQQKSIVKMRRENDQRSQMIFNNLTW